MAQDDHKLFSSPLSSSGGFRRGDSKTWFVLSIAGAVAVVIVVLLNVFVEKPNLRWPSTQPQTQPAATPASDEPRSYDVAPPGAVPPPPPG